MNSILRRKERTHECVFSCSRFQTATWEQLPVTLSARFFVTLVRFVFSWDDTFWRTSNHLPGRKMVEQRTPLHTLLCPQLDPGQADSSSQSEHFRVETNFNSHSVERHQALLLMKISQARKWKPAVVFLSGKSHGQRGLVGDSPWSREELDTTEHAIRQN